MKNTTLEFALSILDAQFGYIPEYSNNRGYYSQKAYYDGMLQMLNLIISDGFTAPGYVEQLAGKHTAK